MARHVSIKICGLTRPGDVSAAVDAGADYVGFVFFKRSPRYVSYDQAAQLAAPVPDHVRRVALCVDPVDADLERLVKTVPLEMIQLHGSESPERVTEVRSLTGLPVMKAIGIETADDLAAIDTYSDVADQLLIDTKPPKDATRPGGNARAFDWALISGRTWSLPWLLAGGLTPENVAEAIRVTGTEGLDLSSGVESAPGVKDATKIQNFIASARQ